MGEILSQLSINPKIQISLAHQLTQQITWLIASGALKRGDPLPSLRQVAEHLSINLHTVRSAYKILELEGKVDTRQGRETLVLGIDSYRIARAVASARTHTVGVILPTLANPFYHAFLEGLSEEADNHQTLLFVCDAREDSTEAWRYLIQLTAKQVDGVVVASHRVDRFLYAGEEPSPGQAKTLPLIMVDAPDASGPAVLLDLKGAGYRATRHLIEHGHRRIGLITVLFDYPNVLPLNEGYVQALQEAEIPVDLSLVVRVKGFDPAAGAEGARYLAGLPQPPTAVFAIADTMAVGALNAFKAMQRRVPEDIALVGFNDIWLAEQLDPPLTTVSAPAYEMGTTAMRLLQTLIAGKPLTQSRIVLPTSLVVRQSCGCHAIDLSPMKGG